jgi:hypothetical protein
MCKSVERSYVLRERESRWKEKKKFFFSCFSDRLCERAMLMMEIIRESKKILQTDPLKYFRNVKRILKIIVLPIQCILRTLNADSHQTLLLMLKMTCRLIDPIYYDAHWMIEC